MADERVRRKLAAILAADMVGYSRLMEADEAGTIARQKAHRNDLIDPAIAAHNGRIVKTTGDGLLAVFSSVLDAVTCAVEVQRAMSKREADTPDDRRILYRVGINLGDIVIEGDDVLGDGVNVAARLESLAGPGSICISGTAHDTLRGAIADEFAEIGERSVKNISRPIRIYSWKSGGDETSAPVDRSSTKGRKPTISLGAFDPVGADPEAENLAVAVYDGVQSAWSNLTGTTLVSNPQHADYLLSARFQTNAGRFRAMAALKDRAAGSQFWSERFAVESTDPFEAQDEISARISGAARFAVYAREFEKHGSELSENADTQTLLSQAGFLLLGTNIDQWLQARAMAEEVIARDPENFMAWGIHSFTHLYNSAIGYGEAGQDDLAQAEEAALRSVSLNGTSDIAHALLAAVYLNAGDLSNARREVERSLDLNSHSPMTGLVFAQTLIYDGYPEEGIVRALQAAEIFKRMPIYYAPLYYLALGHFVCRRYAEAIEWAERSRLHAPNVPKSLIVLTAAAALDQTSSLAKDYAGRLMAEYPDFSVTALRRPPFRDPEPWHRLIDGLRKAGVPEN